MASKKAFESFAEAIAKLRKSVPKELKKQKKKAAAKAKPKPKPKPKEKVDHTSRTKSIKEQLKQSDTEFLSDAEKAAKRKREKEKRKGK